MRGLPGMTGDRDGFWASRGGCRRVGIRYDKLAGNDWCAVIRAAVAGVWR